VGEEGGHLRLQVAGGVLDVVGLVGLPEEQRRRAMGGAELGGEGRLPGRHQTVHYQPAGVAVVGMEPVAAPGVVAEEDLGSEPADHLADPPPLADARLELAVGEVEEVDLSAPEPPGGLHLLGVPGPDEVGHVAGLLPGPLRAVGEDEMVDAASPGRPLGQGGAAAELDVVGVGAHRQCRGGHGDVEGDRSVVGKVADGDDAPGHPPSQPVSTPGMSEGRSTSACRAGSRTMRRPTPRRSASAQWRTKEPGP
jgi:hypothetical protein